MNIIKLSAIASTNTFLKELTVTKNVENFTIVVTDDQLQGKGQRGNVWSSEAGKNLTFSMYVSKFDFKTNGFFLLNILVPISIVEVLESFQIKNLKIKWPNDILAENKKIGGILIENSFKSQTEISSIVGIGLNINQAYFENLPQAASLFQLKGQLFDKEEILYKIVYQIQFNIENIGKVSPNSIWDKYHNLLFRKDKPSTFLDVENKPFVGIIRGVTKEGLLQIELEDAIFKTFEIKEVKLLY